MGVLAAGLSQGTDDRQNVGGVKALYFANKTDFVGTPTYSSHTITAMTLDTGKVWYAIAPEDYTIKCTWESVGGGMNKPAVKTKVEMYIPYQSVATSLFVENLRKANGVYVAAEMITGMKKLYGYDAKVGTQGVLYLTGAVADSGAKPEDQTGITITLEGEQVEVPYDYTMSTPTS